MSRDKIFSHDKTMITSKSVSSREGVSFRPMTRFGPLEDRHKKIFLLMKAQYESSSPTLKVTNNDYEMVNDLFQQIRREKIKLEKNDLDDLVISYRKDCRKNRSENLDRVNFE